MKSILLSIKPEWVAKILNGEKTIEVRKKFPKEYVGWVYIYCTKGKPNLWLPYEYDCFKLDELSQPYLSDKPIIDYDYKMNGKVVARFWCDKVEEIKPEIWTPKLEQEILKGSCLTENALFKYVSKNNGEQDNPFFAIHISKLEIFDKPKELGEFKSYKKNIVNTKINGMVFETELDNSLIKAPQNYCYIEGE